MSKVILISDLHLREDVPPCRLETQEEWYNHQYDRLSAVADTATLHDCPIVVAGDIFHRPKVASSIVHMFIDIFRKHRVYIMAGNHDVRYADLTDTDNGYAILKLVFPEINILDNSDFIPYGSVFENNRLVGKNIVALHTLCFESEDKVPYGVKHYTTATKLLTLIDSKLIVVGDMHRPFSVQSGNKTVINCGCMTVQRIDESKYKQGFWVYDFSTKSHEMIPYGDEMKIQFSKNSNDVEFKEDAENRVQALIERVKTQTDIDLDFESNLNNLLTTNEISGKVSERIRHWIEEGVTNE